MSEQVRVLCRIPNAGAEINGVPFGTLNVDDQRVRVSSRIAPEVAERFCRIEGYELWEPDSPDQDEAAEAAIEKAKASRPEAQVASGFEQTIQELQRANQAMATDYDAVRARNEALEAEVAALRKQLEAAGVASDEPVNPDGPDLLDDEPVSKAGSDDEVESNVTDWHPSGGKAADDGPSESQEPSESNVSEWRPSGGKKAGGRKRGR